MEKKESLGKWIVLGILIIISLVGVFVFAVVLSKPSKVQTISESTLRGALEISELSTVEYTYNAVARAYDEDSKTLMYSKFGKRIKEILRLLRSGGSYTTRALAAPTT